MKTILWVFLLMPLTALGQYTLGGRSFYFPTAAGAFTLAQPVATCSAASVDTCTMTFTQALVAGNLDIFACGITSYAQPNPGIEITGVTAGGTLVAAPGASSTGTATLGSIMQESVAYILPSTSTGGSATEVLTLSGAASNSNNGCYGVELHPSANPSEVALDIDGAYQSATASTSNVDIPLTLSGTNDAVFKMYMNLVSSTGAASSVTSPYNTNFKSASGLGFSVAANPGSGSAETWTSGSSVIPGLISLAFGWTPTSSVEQMYIDWAGGTSGSAATASTLAASVHGFQGGGWALNGTMTFENAGSMSLQHATGRLFGDGVNYPGTSTLSLAEAGTGSAIENLATYTWGGSSNLGSVSAGWWFCSTLPNTDATIMDIGGIGGNGSAGAGVNWHGNGTNRFVQLETGTESTGTVIIANDGSGSCDSSTHLSNWNFIEVQHNPGGTSHLMVFNTSGVQVGSTLNATAGTLPATNFQLGHSAAQSMTSGNYNYYGPAKVDLTGTFPLTQ